MTSFLAGVAAYTVLIVLVVAVVERFRAPRALPAALTAHRVLPRAAARPVAIAVTAAEMVLAVALVVGPGPLALAGAAVLFAAYGGYGWYVAGTGRGGPCGCGGVEVPMDGWVAGRGLVLAGLAAFAAATDGSVPPLSQFGSDQVVVLLAAGTFGTLLWHLPAAMHLPSRTEVMS